MSDGIKVVKTGRTIDSPDASDFYVDSDTPLLKIFEILRGSYDYISGFQEFQIYHGLGYTPTFLLFMDRRTDGSRQLATSEDTDFNDTLVAGDKEIMVNAVPDELAINVTVSASPSHPMAGEYSYTLIVFYDEVFSE